MAYASATHGLPGVFITFEGGEGVGKTTQIAFMERVLKKAGLDVVRLREPGGTKVGEDLRAIVLDAKNDMLDDRAELYLYEAARAQIVAEVIRPALARGAVVLCDRFVDSTVAYQGYGRGLDPDFVRQANEFACQGILPDRTVLLTVDSTSLGLRRATRRLGADRLELAGTEFHQRVNEGFAKIAAAHPDRVRTVSSSTTKSAAARGVWEAVGDVLEAAFGVTAPCDADFANLDRPRRRPSGATKGSGRTTGQKAAEGKKQGAAHQGAGGGAHGGRGARRRKRASGKRSDASRASAAASRADGAHEGNRSQNPASGSPTDGSEGARA
ncbi:dTMP kinase [Slackia piriformis]|nr:dTMP kinase [Slackia piriformis]